MELVKGLEGKIIEKVENNNTDIVFYFTDGTLLGIDATEDTHLTVNMFDNKE